MSNGTLTSAISSFILEIMCPQNAQHSVKEEVGRRKWKRVRCGRDREREWVGGWEKAKAAKDYAGCQT